MQQKKNKLLYGTFAALTIMYLTGWSTPACATSIWWHHFTYMFFHANIFHLAGNIYAIWIIRKYLTIHNVVSSYIICVLASWTTFVETIGASGFIYSLVAYSMLSTKPSIKYWVMFMLVNLAASMFPEVSFGVHFTSFALAAIYMKLRLFYNEYGR